MGDFASSFVIKLLAHNGFVLEDLTEVSHFLKNYPRAKQQKYAAAVSNHFFHASCN